MFGYFNHWAKVVKTRKMCLESQILIKMLKGVHYQRRKLYLQKWYNQVTALKLIEAKVTVHKNEGENEMFITD